MMDAGRAQGLTAFAAHSLVLAFLCLFMFVFNGGYSLILLVRHSSFSLFLPKAHARYFLFAMRGDQGAFVLIEQADEITDAAPSDGGKQKVESDTPLAAARAQWTPLRLDGRTVEHSPCSLSS